MRLHGFFVMVLGMQVMSMSKLRMMRGFLVMPFVMMLGSMVVMLRGVLVMLGCLLVMLVCCSAHNISPLLPLDRRRLG